MDRVGLVRLEKVTARRPIPYRVYILEEVLPPLLSLYDHVSTKDSIGCELLGERLRYTFMPKNESQKCNGNDYFLRYARRIKHWTPSSMWQVKWGTLAFCAKRLP
jgi:hypothetical protein